MSKKFSLSAQVSGEMAGMRLDLAAARLFPDYSRERLKGWIKAGNLLVDDRAVKTRHKLLGGENLLLRVETEAEPLWRGEAIGLDVVHEDEAIIVINKPPGLVVHPAAGNRSGTLLNALVHHCPEMAEVPRAGIVHRLDKGTAGLLVAAKTLPAHLNLVEQLRRRQVVREYQALVNGVLTAGGTVDAPLGRDPRRRTRQAVVRGRSGKNAVTHYRVLARFRHFTLVRLKLETGRTHQIRVHMAYVGHPLVGDPVYGGRLKIPAGAAPELAGCLHAFRRQALHAFRLGFHHPASGEFHVWEIGLPADMRKLVDLLEKDRDR